MNCTKLCLTSILCAGVLFAQDEPAPAKPRPAAKPDHPYHVALTEILGSKVKLEPNARERAAATAEHRMPERPEVKLQDLIIDCRSGHASWAILDAGSKEVAVPSSALTCAATAETPCAFELGATEAELSSLPAFDKAVLERSGLEVAMKTADTSWRRVRPDAKPAEASTNADAKAADATADAAKRCDAILATQVKGLVVRCGDAKPDTKFGTVDTACVETGTCRVSYMVVGRGGVLGIGESDYLVPWAATAVLVEGSDRKPVAVLAKTTAEMEGAPKYTKPTKGVVNDEGGQTCCDFYGVDCKTGKVKSDAKGTR